eukprot:TRINITY_DN971_c0_g1_i1.p1 TRINITY_DN971_c0_g1~~TRINITY_DN971_c0_g1_i1.p1  ORF type:complete len:348 (-),score=78.27 TRINITY_DN971_c0_g1_i1:54-1097(-)
MDTMPPAVVLSDFGTAMTHVPADVSIEIRGAVGTPPYMAPEVKKCIPGVGKFYIGHKSDIWSFGALVLETVTAGHLLSSPFLFELAGPRNKPKSNDFYSDEEWAEIPRNDLWNAIPVRLRQMICSCIRLLPADRLTAQQLQQQYSDILPPLNVAMDVFCTAMSQLMAKTNDAGFTMRHGLVSAPSSSGSAVPNSSIQSKAQKSQNSPVHSPKETIEAGGVPALTPNMEIFTKNVPARILPELTEKAFELGKGAADDETLIELIPDAQTRKTAIVELLFASACLGVNLGKTSLFRTNFVPGYVRPGTVSKMISFSSRLVQLDCVREFSDTWERLNKQTDGVDVAQEDM